MSLNDLIRKGDLETVDPDADAAAAGREEAARHVESAKKIGESDPHGAYQLAYDAARKAIVALIRDKGVRRGEGAHVISGLYARAEIDDDLGKRFERMRRARNTSEYGVGHFETAQVEDAISTAEAILTAVEAEAA